jgi:hypothetical protein
MQKKTTLHSLCVSTAHLRESNLQAELAVVGILKPYK